MKAKLCFNEEIHRVSKLPDTFQGLTQLVSSLFHSPLPEPWTLQYKDSEGDNILIHDENDYEEFKSGELKASSAIVKIYVIPTSAFKSSEINKEEESIIMHSENKKDEFQVVEDEEVKPNNVVEVKEEVYKAPVVEEPKENKKSEGDCKPSVEAETPQETPKEDAEETPKEGNEETPGSEETPEEPKSSKVVDNLNAILNEDFVKKEEVEEKAEEKSLENLYDDLQAKLSKSFVSEEEVEEKVEEKRVEEPEEEKKEEVYEPKVEAKDNKVYIDVNDLQKLISNMIDKSLPAIVQRTHQQLEEQRSLSQSMIMDNNTSILSERLNASALAKIVHHGVKCDGCNMMPITGYRYKCTVCPNYNYCETCEDNSEHPHNFIKMKKRQSVLGDAVSVLKPAQVDVSNLKVSEWMKFNPNKGSLVEELERVRNEGKGQESKKQGQGQGKKSVYDSNIEKAEKLQKCFPKEDFDNLCIFVSEAPEDMSLEELVENYKFGMKEKQ